MSVKRIGIKRFLKSHILHISVAALILFATVFFPMMFAYPPATGEERSIIVVFVIFACVFEVLVYIFVSHYFFYARVNKASKHLCDMAQNGNPEKIFDTSIDNTTEYLFNAVNATADEYVRLEQVRKSFVSNASHELRSPLTSVQGFLQAVLDGTISEADKEKYLNIALNETKRLNALITAMLDLSRLDSGKNPLVLTKFDINDIINDAAARFEPALIKKALQINVEFSQPNCYVYADKDKIIQVITNLVDNAIKYSPAYSRIILKTSVHENKAYVTVRDYGYGISKKDQMLIWDRFYMTDKSRSPVKTKGSGLGLSIVKKIIDELGEVIWVESSRGAGATFIFTLTLFDPSKHRVETGNVIKSPIASVGNGENTRTPTFTEN